MESPTPAAEEVGGRKMDSAREDAQASTQASGDSSIIKQEVPTVDNNPKLWIPLKKGWRRELVNRGIMDDAGLKADAYYFTPEGKKLRSLKEIVTYLGETDDHLSLDSFTFSRQPINAGPEYETIRDARPAFGLLKPKTNPDGKPLKKRVWKRRRPRLLGTPSSVIQLPDGGASQSLSRSPRRHSLMEKSRRAFVLKAMELKKKVPASPRKQKLKAITKQSSRTSGDRSAADDPTCANRALVYRPWQLTEVNGHGEVVRVTHSPDFRASLEYLNMVRDAVTPHTSDQVLIGRRQCSPPCSLFCFSDRPQAPVALPSAQCLVCRCLSHPSCAGLDDPLVKNYICVDCYRGVEKDEGFDAIGDPVVDAGDRDHVPDSDGSLFSSDSEADMDTRLPTVPLPSLTPAAFQHAPNSNLQVPARDGATGAERQPAPVTPQHPPPPPRLMRAPVARVPSPISPSGGAMSASPLPQADKTGRRYVLVGQKHAPSTPTPSCYRPLHPPNPPNGTPQPRFIQPANTAPSPGHRAILVRMNDGKEGHEGLTKFVAVMSKSNVTSEIMTKTVATPSLAKGSYVVSTTGGHLVQNAPPSSGGGGRTSSTTSSPAVKKRSFSASPLVGEATKRQRVSSGSSSLGSPNTESVGKCQRVSSGSSSLGSPNTESVGKCQRVSSGSISLGSPNTESVGSNPRKQVVKKRSWKEPA